MKGIRLVSILLMFGLFVVSIGLTPVVVASGTANASATATGGENCAQADGKGSGGLTVVQVKVNGVPLDKSKGDFTVERDGSSQVIVKFTTPLSGGAPGPPPVAADKVEISYSTGNRGTHTVNITLKKC